MDLRERQIVGPPELDQQSSPGFLAGVKAGAVNGQVVEKKDITRLRRTGQRHFQGIFSRGKVMTAARVVG
jgi:hypothetical protein